MELRAILAALQTLEMAHQGTPLPTPQVIILTDSLGSLQQINKAAFLLDPPSPVVEDILVQIQVLQSVQTTGPLKLVLQKVGAHTGMPGNDEADALAKAAASLQHQPQLPIPQSDLKGII